MCLQLHWGGLKLWTMTVISKNLQQCLIILRGLENHHFASLILLGNFLSNNFLNYLLKYFSSHNTFYTYPAVLKTSQYGNWKWSRPIKCHFKMDSFFKKELLKSVFSEIRVRLNSSGFPTKKRPLISWPSLPKRGQFFGGKSLEFISYLGSQKKMTLGV